LSDFYLGYTETGLVKKYTRQAITNKRIQGCKDEYKDEYAEMLGDYCWTAHNI
jgi:hypothetical protein